MVSLKTGQPVFVSTGFQILLPFKVVFQHECHLIEFDCQSLKWVRFGAIADLDCYLHQSSCLLVNSSEFC